MTHERLPELFAPGDPIPENKRQSILAAQAILCVSENTKRDLLEFYSIPEEKITVTPLASELDLSLSYGEEATPPQPYFLYVGSRVQYKNFGVLLKAFAKVCSLNSEVQLGVVGSALTPEEIQQINELQLTDRIVLFQKVSDRHLAKLYRCSMALVYPSLYEGFGIPLLEAMACGTAVVAANSSSIPEVVGDAGILFEPTAVGELADRLLHLLEYPAERDRLIQKGNNRVRQFSWNRTAAQTFAVYRSLVE
jgi:glycosyltransferase involved in cell wall biosynthesis